MLAPQAVDIFCWKLYNYYFTFAEPFDDIFLFVKSSCALVSGNTNERKEGVTGLADEQASEFALAHLTPISYSAK